MENEQNHDYRGEMKSCLTSVTLGKKKAGRIKDGIRKYVSLLCDSSMALLAGQASGDVVKKSCLGR